MPKRAPRRRVAHRGWRTSYVTNSARGSVSARNSGAHWVDNDFHLTYEGADWGNDHGAPLHLFFRKGDRMERHPSSDVFALKRVVDGREYHVRTLREALEDNHHEGLGTEIEIKDVRPWATHEILTARFAEMARTAAEVYGDTWRAHVVVKVLTNLGGGERYALKICRHAHAQGIPTMLLVRGRARFKHYYGHPAVDWVRGSVVIR